MIGHLTLETVTEALGWAVVHFLWQGVVIGAIAWAALLAARRASAVTRYAIGCAAMACCTLAFLSTFLVVVRPAGAGFDGSALNASASGVLPFPVGAPDAITSNALPAEQVAWLWIGGVVFFSVRVALHWLGARRLKANSISAPNERWRQAFDTLKADLGVNKAVRMLQSGLAQTPMVVGWFSPIVLVPVTAFTSLTPEQLRAVLVHELAHIRRHDHLVDAELQVVIETLLFFHPIVWWLSSRVRLEREHCCDDAAVLAAGHPRIFAEALAQLESLRITNPQVALAANGGPLMNRIARILGSGTPRSSRAATLRTAAALTAGALVAVAGMAQAAPPKEREAAKKAELAEQPTRIKQPAPERQVDPLVLVLRDAVEMGVSPDEVRVIYDSVVFPSSDAQQAADAEFAKVSQELDRAVASGRISQSDADKRLAGLSDKLAQRQEMTFSVDVLGMSKGQAYVALQSDKIDELVRAGKLSREEADKKLVELRQSVVARERVAADMGEVGAKLRRKVEAGEMTPEEAREKMVAIEKGVAVRARYEKVAAELKAMVDAGEITEEQAKERLEGFSRSLAKENQRRDIDWEAIRRRIEGAVERGDMTREEADEAYKRIKQRLTGARDGEKREDEAWRHIAGALSESGIERDKIRDVMGAMKRIVGEIRAEGDRFELDLNLKQFLVELGLDDEQLREVVELSRRLAAAPDRGERDPHDDGDGKP